MAKATQQEMIDKVTAEEAMKWMDRGEDVIFVDTRNPQAWSQSNEKLPGAIRIPAEEVERHLNEISTSGSKERRIVTYCT